MISVLGKLEMPCNLGAVDSLPVASPRHTKQTNEANKRTLKIASCCAHRLYNVASIYSPQLAAKPFILFIDRPHTHTPPFQPPYQRRHVPTCRLFTQLPSNIIGSLPTRLPIYSTLNVPTDIQLQNLYQSAEYFILFITPSSCPLAQTLAIHQSRIHLSALPPTYLTV